MTAMLAFCTYVCTLRRGRTCSGFAAASAHTASPFTPRTHLRLLDASALLFDLLDSLRESGEEVSVAKATGCQLGGHAEHLRMVGDKPSELVKVERLVAVDVILGKLREPFRLRALEERDGNSSRAIAAGRTGAAGSGSATRG